MTMFVIRVALEGMGIETRHIKTKEQLCHLYSKTRHMQNVSDYTSPEWEYHETWEQEMDEIILDGDADALREFLDVLPNEPFTQKLILSALVHIFRRDSGQQNTIFTRQNPTPNDLAIVETLIDNVNDVNTPYHPAFLASVLFQNTMAEYQRRNYLYLEMLLDAGLTLHNAIEQMFIWGRKYGDMIKLLLDRIDDTNVNQTDLERILFLVIDDNQASILRYMIEKGLYIPTDSLLLRAIAHEVSPEIIYLLINAGVIRSDFQEAYDYLDRISNIQNEYPNEYPNDHWVQEVLEILEPYVGNRKLQ